MTFKKIICLCFTCLLFITILNFGIDRYFYPNNDKNNKPEHVFFALTQILSPDTLYSTFQFEPNLRLGFSYYTIESSFAATSSFNSLQTTKLATFQFKFGKMFYQKFSEDYQTYLQNIFMEPQPEQKLDNNIDSEYIKHAVWVQFSEPLQSVEFEKKYGYLFERDRQNFIWIPVKTSDDLRASCLGVEGDASLHSSLFRSIGFTPPAHAGEYSTLPYREDFFEQMLLFLAEREKETDIFLQSGFWGEEAKDVDFSAAYNYIKENGYQYLGFVAYLTSEDIVNISEDPNNNVFKIVSRT